MCKAGTDSAFRRYQMSKLVGRTIADSPKIQSLIKELAAEVAREDAALNTVRAPQAEFGDYSKSLMDQTNKVRGRPLFYPFIGTGAGHGAYVEVIDGSVKLDLINGIGVNIMGHSHPRVISAAIRGAMSDVVMQGNLEPGMQYATLGKKLVDLASKNSRLKHCWFATCGTMANETALKLARQKH